MGLADIFENTVSGEKGSKSSSSGGRDGSGSGSGLEDAEALKASLRSRRKGGTSLDEKIKAAAEKEQLAALFEPEQWGPIATLPFDIRYGMTGWEGFLRTPEQRTRLGASLSALMQTLPIQMKSWVIAGLVFGVQFGSQMAQAEMGYRKEKAKDNVGT